MAKKKRRNRKNCKYHDAYDDMIECNNSESKSCLCLKICKLFEPYVAPFVEKHFDN